MQKNKSKKPRVLFVSSGKVNGLPGPIVRSQGDSLIKAGVDLQYFTITKKGLFGYLSETFRLRVFLKSNRVDIIHAHYSLTALLCVFARKKEKLVVSFMGSDLLGARKSDGSKALLSRLLATVIARFAGMFAHCIIVKSNEMIRHVIRNKAVLIPNGVNIELFKPDNKVAAKEKLGFSKSEKLVIFVSDPARTEKNYRLSKGAVERLQWPDVVLKPLFGTSQPELVDFYNAADVMVLSSFYEGSPNVIKEAMACNVPVVSTKVGDVQWVIGDTSGCYLADHDVDDFAAKLKLALCFAEEEGRTNGRQRIMQLGLDGESVANRLLDAYGQVKALNK